MIPGDTTKDGVKIWATKCLFAIQNETLPSARYQQEDSWIHLNFPHLISSFLDLDVLPWCQLRVVRTAIFQQIEQNTTFYSVEYC